MKSKTISGAPAVGSSSLITVFAVLCLSIFSVLTLSTAESNQKISVESASAVSAYYSADTEAEEIYAEIRQNIKENDNLPNLQKMPEGVQANVTDTEAINKELNITRNTTETESDNALNDNNLVVNNNGNYAKEWMFKYSCVVDENQNLNVILLYDGSSFSVMEWKVVRNTDWIPDENIKVWNGE